MRGPLGAVLEQRAVQGYFVPRVKSEQQDML